MHLDSPVRLGLLLAALCSPLAPGLAGQALAQEEFTAANWGEQVGFKPDLTQAESLKGKTIDKSNVKEVEALIPPSMKMMIEKHNLVLKLRDYEPIRPSKGYIEATNKYRGRAKVLDIGADFRKRGLDGYVAGLPFPKPKDGQEVAWDYQYSYNGDDGDTYYTVFWISGSSGIEHQEEWRWAFIIRTINRTDLDPRPAIESFLKKNIQYTSMTYALAPYDKKGFGALYSRSTEPLDQQGHIYVPAMRRVLRNTFGTRGDTWNSTDLLYEDVRGYMGYPEWMSWKLIGQKTMLMPLHAGTKLGKDQADKTYDLKNKPYWNPKLQYELRPMYVVEVTPKFPDYPYSKMVMYFDAETFLLPYKETYDKKGDLWKVILIGLNASKDMNTQPPEFGACAVIDFQAEHATLFNFHKALSNVGLDPNMFTLANLRKRGK